MNENDGTQEQEQDGNADQGSGERPESPEEATSPPGNPEVDEERVDDAEEDAERTAPY
jgi:hypothetical protein